MQPLRQQAHPTGWLLLNLLFQQNRPQAAFLQPFAGPRLPAQLIYRHGRHAETRVRSFVDFAPPRLRAHPAFNG